MLTQEARQELEKQQYKIVGQHSAVKTCGWTKKMVKGEGGCYKFVFYGIKSHQCMQMTTSMSCANRCEFCWRGYKAPVSKEWNWGIDDPEWIIDKSIQAQRTLMYGFKGNPNVKEKTFAQSMMPEHVALSLTGEPIMYPKINEICRGFHQRHISTFLVTNAQYPESIRDLELVTQLYISVDAPNKELLKKIDKPLFSDYWERLNKSLEYLAQKKERTCIRLTLIKEENMCDMEGYATLIHKGDPDFLEVKGYMYVGASQQRLTYANMPMHEEVVIFSQELVKLLPEYEIVSEHIPSRVVMLAKKKFKKEDGWYTWIDFPKFHELVLSGKDFTSEDYLRKTPQVGISGHGTI